MNQKISDKENVYDLENLKGQLKNLGFDERIFSALEFYMQYPQQNFVLLEKQRTENERIQYTLHFEKNQSGNYDFKSYDAMLRICPPIPDLTIRGINTKELDALMKKFDWSFDQHTEDVVHERLQTPKGRTELSEIERIMNHIHRLHNSTPGKDASEKLMFKHWMDTPYEPNVFSLDHLKQKHEWKCTVNVYGTIGLTKTQSYDFLKNTLATDLLENEELSENKLLFNSIKTNVMNEQNLEYLKDNIKYMGFGEKLNEQLENNLKQGKDDFKLDFKAEVNKKPFEASLHFRKSDSSEMYFFNSYDASLQKGNGEKADQTFYLNKGKGITAKEAYNLLDGRAVHKELTNKENVPYKAWVQLDFQNKDKYNNFEVKQFHENYGFDLKGEVGKYAIVELKDAEKEKALMQSLQKGNIQSVTIEKDDSTQKMFMEANPQFKSVTLYDGQMKRVQKEALEQYKSVSQSQGNEVKKEQKQEVKQDVNKDNKQKASKEIDKPKQIKSHSKKRSVSM